MTGPVCQQIKAEVSSLCDAPPGRYLIMYEIDIRAFGGSLSTSQSLGVSVSRSLHLLASLSLRLSVSPSGVLLFAPSKPRALSYPGLARHFLVTNKLETMPNKSAVLPSRLDSDGILPRGASWFRATRPSERREEEGRRVAGTFETIPGFVYGLARPARSWPELPAAGEQEALPRALT